MIEDLKRGELIEVRISAPWDAIWLGNGMCRYANTPNQDLIFRRNLKFRKDERMSRFLVNFANCIFTKIRFGWRVTRRITDFFHENQETR